MAKMYFKYEAEITQLEAEEGISNHFDFIKKYEKDLHEHNFKNFDNEQFHEVRKKLEAVFQERLGLESEQSAKLFRSYTEHYSNAYEMQEASRKYFEIEEKIQVCVDNDVIAKTALRGLRDCYAQSVNAPFEFRGDVGAEIARIEQLVNYKTMLSKRLSEYHEISASEAESMVDKFTDLQHLNVKQLVQSRMNDEGHGRR